jgi:hypothetical protein
MAGRREDVRAGPGETRRRWGGVVRWRSGGYPSRSRNRPCERRSGGTLTTVPVLAHRAAAPAQGRVFAIRLVDSPPVKDDLRIGLPCQVGFTERLPLVRPRWAEQWGCGRPEVPFIEGGGLLQAPPGKRQWPRYVLCETRDHGPCPHRGRGAAAWQYPLGDVKHDSSVYRRSPRATRSSP